MKCLPIRDLKFLSKKTGKSSPTFHVIRRNRRFRKSRIKPSPMGHEAIDRRMPTCAMPLRMLSRVFTSIQGDNHGRFSKAFLDRGACPTTHPRGVGWKGKGRVMKEYRGRVSLLGVRVIRLRGYEMFQVRRYSCCDFFLYLPISIDFL